MRALWIRAWQIHWAAWLGACASVEPPEHSKPETPQFGVLASFDIDKSALRDKGAPDELIEKIDSSAYRYFRLLAPQYSGRTCYAFRDLRWHLPLVALHGDAHVGQFVVTGKTAGLEDFDQSGFGPAVVDIVRYAASLYLACKEVSFDCDANALVDSYLAAYRAALDEQPHPTLPKIAARLRREAPQSRLGWLDESVKLMRPIADAEHIKHDFSAFSHLQVQVDPSRSEEEYEIVHLGSLQLGIGSFLERKLLFRVRGPTDAPEDDEILEARWVNPPTSVECAWRPPHAGSLQALMFMSLLGRRMPDVFGFAVFDRTKGAPEFWVQSWDAGYHELELSDLSSQDELEELARDGAAQLAGHFWWKFPEQLRMVQRIAQLRAFDMTRDRAKALALELASETEAAWQRFRSSK